MSELPRECDCRGCPHAKLYWAVLNSVLPPNVPDTTFDHTYSECFCVTCLRQNRTSRLFYRRTGGVRHTVPHGWTSFAVRISPFDVARGALRDWPVGFVGIADERVLGGVLKKESVGGHLSGDVVPYYGDDVKTPPAAAGSEADGKKSEKYGSRLEGLRLFEKSEEEEEEEEEGEVVVEDPQKSPHRSEEDSSFLLLSPSIRYVENVGRCARIPVGDFGTFIIALRCRVNPAGYVPKEETLLTPSEKDFVRIDPFIPNHEIEWRTSRRSVLVVSDVLVRTVESVPNLTVPVKPPAIPNLHPVLRDRISISITKREFGPKKRVPQRRRADARPPSERRRAAAVLQPPPERRGSLRQRNPPQVASNPPSNRPLSGLFAELAAVAERRRERQRQRTEEEQRRQERERERQQERDRRRTAPRPPRAAAQRRTRSDYSLEELCEMCADQGVCTFSQTRREFTMQRWYHCSTHGYTGNNGLCEGCRNVCHRDCNTYEASQSPSRFYCDCGDQRRVCRCINRQLDYNQPPPNATTNAPTPAPTTTRTTTGTASRDDNRRGVALYDFEPSDEEEVRLREGDAVLLLRDVGEWYYLRNVDFLGEEGYAPANYVEVEEGSGSGSGSGSGASAGRDDEGLLIAPPPPNPMRSHARAMRDAHQHDPARQGRMRPRGGPFGRDSGSATATMRGRDRGTPAAGDDGYAGIVMYSFEGMDDEELGVGEGEDVRVLRDTGEWLFVRNSGGMTGYVPASYIQRRQ